MRMRKKAWADSELETNELLVKEPTNLKGNWNKYFKNNNPIYIEIGCGKGRFLTETAKLNKSINFIGIEVDKSVMAVALRKITDKTDNIAFICTTAEYLTDFFDAGEVSRIYLNFSDPWPRKKWAKRRLTHKNFLNIYKNIFGVSGEIFFKTDNRNLFEFSLNELSSFGLTLKNISLDLHNSSFEGNIMTEYEEKFSSEGLPIYRVEAYYNKNC